MVIIELFSWWFSAGWYTFAKKLSNSLSNLTDYFSLSSLVRTLFQPYRQISAGKADNNASLELKFHAFTDRFVSRCVGFISRLILIIVGLILIIISATLGAILLIIWPLIPFAPIVGIVLTIMGVTL